MMIIPSLSTSGNLVCPLRNIITIYVFDKSIFGEKVLFNWMSTKKWLYSGCLDVSGEVGVKIVVDGGERVEDHAESNDERKEVHF